MRVRGQRRGERPARLGREVSPRVGLAEDLHIGGGEACGGDAVDELGVERAERRRRPTSSSTAARSGVATATSAVVLRSRRVAAMRRPWRAIGPTAAAEANVRGASSSASP